MRKSNMSCSLLDEFRKSRGQILEQSNEVAGKKSNKGGRNPYDVFLARCSNLDKYIDKFSLTEMVFYFKKTAEDNGYKCMINFPKDSSVMKKLKGTYSNREICGMIEFLFESEQDYLNKHSLGVSIFSTNWVGTIYADTLLWVKDEYVPKSKSSKKQRDVAKKEWDKKSEDNVNIGVKL